MTHARRRLRPIVLLLTLALGLVWVGSVGTQATAVTPGRITGTVTGPGGLPVQNIDVAVYRNFPVVDDWDYVTSVKTTADGTYDLPDLEPATYRVGFSDSAGNHLDEYYANAPTVETGAGVVVTSGGTTSGTDAQLALAGHITGTITGIAGRSLDKVVVSVFRHEGDDWTGLPGALVAADGTYDIGGLPSGAYNLAFRDDDNGYLSEYFDDVPFLTSATDVVVTAGTTAGGKNAELAPTLDVVVLPKVSGTARVGSPLMASTGTWEPSAGLTYSYQWRVAETDVPGATGATYTPLVADLGKTVGVEVVAMNAESGSALTARSDDTAPVAKGILKATTKPRVVGEAKPNTTVGVHPGTWSPSARATFRWYAGTKVIRGATAAKLKLSGAILRTVTGKPISVVVTLTAPAYSTVKTRLRVPGRI